MSLHTLAQQLQSAGRGQDSVLVHMTPAEVGGLQSLAKAHGGSLTINPETGLPEAGFLSSILPLVAGIALGPAGIGLTAMQSALAVGALGTAATGSLQKGLMAGLGAYGGAGIGAGLSSMGTTAAAPSAGVEALKTGHPGLGGAKIFSTPNYAAVSGVTPTAGAATIAPAASTAAPFATPNYAAVSGVSPVPQVVAQPPVGTIDLINKVNPTAQVSAYSPNLPTNVPALQTSTPLYGASEAASLAPQTATDKLLAGAKRATSGVDGLKNLYTAANKEAPYSALAGLGTLAMGMMPNQKGIEPAEQKGMIRPYEYTREQRPEAYDIGAPIYSDTPGSSRERLFFNDQFTALTPYRAPGPEYMAEGGVATGGPVEEMAALNAVGANTGYPMASIDTPMYSNPMMQRPEATNVLAPSVDAGVGTYTGEPRFAEGGISNLGDYSDGGRLLKGPGNGTSDSIPAVIGEKQPARLAEGEFVIPARIVSELGNGSTDAGAKQLYAMMDRIQKARRKTVGKDKVAFDAKARNELPA